MKNILPIVALMALTACAGGGENVNVHLNCQRGNLVDGKANPHEAGDYWTVVDTNYGDTIGVFPKAQCSAYFGVDASIASQNDEEKEEIRRNKNERYLNSSDGYSTPVDVPIQEPDTIIDSNGDEILNPERSQVAQ